jgi:hypothetical protein
VSEGVVCNRRLSFEILFSQRGGFHEQYYLHRRGSCDCARYSVVCWPCIDLSVEHVTGSSVEMPRNLLGDAVAHGYWLLEYLSVDSF